MKKFFISICLLSIVYGSLAQASSNSNEIPIRKCGTPVLNANYEIWIQDAISKQNQFANNKRVSTIYTLPVVFHILHTGQAVGTTYNISQAQVNSQIAILNQDFRKLNTDFSTTVTQTAFVDAAADCEINFCAARVSPTGAIMAEPGIDRVNTTATYGMTPPPYAGMSSTYIENTIKPATIWDPSKYLNIWITRFSDGVLGYAQFPTIPNGTPTVNDMIGYGGNANTDGVVFDYRYVGNVGAATSPFNKGRTATHEIGHWLGLRHINGDSNCGNDFCADTPAQNTLTGGCPSTIGGVSAAGCGASSPNPPGKMYQNYMDYSDDRCMSMFTTNQKARMQVVMANCIRRTSVASSTVCSLPTGVNENVSDLNVEVFPNPTSGDIYVTVNVLNVQDFTISILNTLGQTIKEVKQSQSNGGTIKIDLTENTKGVYFISIKSKSVSKTMRVILQ